MYWCFGIVDIIMYGIVAFISGFALLKSAKKPNVSIKLMALLMFINTFFTCLLLSIGLSPKSVDPYTTFSSYTYYYLIVTSFELSFWLICYLYLSVYIDLQPVGVKEQKQK